MFSDLHVRILFGSAHILDVVRVVPCATQSIGRVTYLMMANGDRSLVAMGCVLAGVRGSFYTIKRGSPEREGVIPRVVGFFGWCYKGDLIFPRKLWGQPDDAEFRYIVRKCVSFLPYDGELK